MAPARNSLESGFGTDDNSETISHSAQKEFFNTYIPQLEWAVGRNDENEDDDDDLSIDLNHLAKSIAARAPSPIAHRQTKCVEVATRQVNNAQANSTFNVGKKRDLTSEELELVVCQIKNKSAHGEKLADIMLKGLEKDLSSEIFMIFAKTGLPKNWLPIVKMNDENTPYVEILIKADVADQAPDSQLSDYTMQHIAYSQFILDHLREKTQRMRCMPSVQNSGRQQLQNINHNQQQLPIQHHPKPTGQKKVSLIPKPNCSTPLAQKKMRVTNIHRAKQDQNDSKRVLPSRACKANLSYRM